MSRSALAIGAVVLLTVLIASVQTLLPAVLPTPEVALVFVLYLSLTPRGALTPRVGDGLSLSSSEGEGPAFQPRGRLVLHVATALFIGYLADLQAGAPVGLHAFSFAVLSMVARAATRRLLVVSAGQIALVAFFGALGHELFLHAAQVHPPISQLFFTAVSTAVFAPLIFAVGRRIDERLDPVKTTFEVAFR